MYLNLAGDAIHDEEIGPGWQKFKVILETPGGDDNLKEVVKAFGYARQKEQEGWDWETIVKHICRNALLDRDYRELPIGYGEESLITGGIEDLGDEHL